MYLNVVVLGRKGVDDGYEFASSRHFVGVEQLRRLCQDGGQSQPGPAAGLRGGSV